jgi:ABC-2 type transport system ATP-binding protein
MESTDEWPASPQNGGAGRSLSATIPDGAAGDGPAIELSGVARRFGTTDVVHDLTFRVERGTICGLLAPSGGGKTTALRLIAGIYPPSAGRIRVLGHEPAHFSETSRRRIGYMPQHFVLYPELTVRRNLDFMAGIYGLPKAGRGSRIDELLAMVDLSEARNRAARRLSGGMQRRLQLAATLLHQPELVIVDEPTAGIDPLLRARFWAHFRDLRDRGRTLIVSTQYVTEAEYCDHVILMRDGRLIASGSPAVLREQAFGPDAVGAEGTAPSFEDVFRRLMEGPGIRDTRRDE